MDEYMTPAEAAALLGVTRQTILYHIKEGRLAAERLGRVWAIRRAVVEGFSPPKGGWPAGRPRKKEGDE